jgi:hypothetical protein
VTISLTNRALAEITGYNLPSVRKWVVAFLPPDPRVGQYAGVPREHSIDESFRVSLGGDLVSRCGLAIPEAQIALSEIARFLGKRKWMPSDYIAGQESGLPIEILVGFRKSTRGGFGFTLKAVTSRRPKGSSGHFIEEYELIESGTHRGQFGPLHTLRIAADDFVRDVREYLGEEDPSNISGGVKMFHEGKE